MGLSLRTLGEIGGTLSEDQAAFRECLSNIELDAPNGKITLDGNRQAVGTNFVSEVVELPDGTLGTKLVSMVEGVTQTLGVEEAKFRSLGLPSRETPECKTSY